MVANYKLRWSLLVILHLHYFLSFAMHTCYSSIQNIWLMFLRHVHFIIQKVIKWCQLFWCTNHLTLSPGLPFLSLLKIRMKEILTSKDQLRGLANSQSLLFSSLICFFLTYSPIKFFLSDGNWLAFYCHIFDWSLTCFSCFFFGWC